MNAKLKTALSMAGLAILFFGIILDTFFSFTMIFMQIIFFSSGVFCAWGAIHNFTRFFRAYNRRYRETWYNLMFRASWKHQIVTFLTTYRIIISPALLVLLFHDHSWFKWILLSAFLTDALDGFLARRLKVTTNLGAKLDSLADDFLFVVATVAILYLYTDLIFRTLFILTCILLLFLIKMLILVVKHNKMISSMHIYSTKAAAIIQGIFFIHCIFYQPSDFLFYTMITVTGLAIIEEIIIICAFRELKQNIKGLFF